MKTCVMIDIFTYDNALNHIFSHTLFFIALEDLWESRFLNSSLEQKICHEKIKFLVKIIILDLDTWNKSCTVIDLFE